jgi:hypothetical protein
MGVSGATQVRIFSPRPREATVNSSTFPAYVAATRSLSISEVTGDDLFIMRSQVAEALDIRDGDSVKVELVEFGETLTLKVKLKDGLSTDVLIHDLLSLKIAKSVAFYEDDAVVTLKSGRELMIPAQEMWAGMKITDEMGAATLHFDGASRNNPNGPAGYGFHIKRDDNADELIRGYGYAGMNRTSNEVEDMGLLEGLIWATRLDLKRLTIKGDSELIIRQMKGEYQVREPRL